MSLSMFVRKLAPAEAPGFQVSQPSRYLRRDLLRTVLRDVQERTGLPPGWLDIEAMDTAIAGKTGCLHGRFVLKCWAPRVMQHAAALERLFVQRLAWLDPTCEEWFTGLSWRLRLPEGLALAPLPSPAEWLGDAAHPSSASRLRASSERSDDS
ncbi:MAG: hypothetical protein HY854_13415 [Burkholderiales bacterium]|nr:hypothetical protein [Burkholderiales bacterium]